MRLTRLHGRAGRGAEQRRHRDLAALLDDASITTTTIYTTASGANPRRYEVSNRSGFNPALCVTVETGE